MGHGCDYWEEIVAALERLDESGESIDEEPSKADTVWT